MTPCTLSSTAPVRALPRQAHSPAALAMRPVLYRKIPVRLMNETQLIRRSLPRAGAPWRRGAARARPRCQAEPPTPARRLRARTLQQACVEYLALRAGLVRGTRPAPGAAGRRPGQRGSALPHGGRDPRPRGGNAEALAELSAAGANPGVAGAPSCSSSAVPGVRARDALEQLLTNDSRAFDWRLIGGIDADGMLEERTHFARVAALLPAGVSSTHRERGRA